MLYSTSASMLINAPTSPTISPGGILRTCIRRR
jgi:hypothetical protein